MVLLGWAPSRQTRVWPVSLGSVEKAPKCSCFPPPSPGLEDRLSFANPNTLSHPSPLPPQITTRGREKGAIYRCRPCGCPNRAGWGGLGNSWGPGEEAGFPGGDTGPLTWSPQAYLSTRIDPTPTTTGSAKATGKERGGSREPRKRERTTSPAPPGDRQRSSGPQRHLREALKGGDKD